MTKKKYKPLKYHADPTAKWYKDMALKINSSGGDRLYSIVGFPMFDHTKDILLPIVRSIVSELELELYLINKHS